MASNTDDSLADTASLPSNCAAHMAGTDDEHCFAPDRRSEVLDELVTLLGSNESRHRIVQHQQGHEPVRAGLLGMYTAIIGQWRAGSEPAKWLQVLDAGADDVDPLQFWRALGQVAGRQIPRHQPDGRGRLRRKAASDSRARDRLLVSGGVLDTSSVSSSAFSGSSLLLSSDIAQSRDPRSSVFWSSVF